MQRGFSLVELALVIVIIGLVAGGIIGGQSLIRSSNLKSQTHQISHVKSAVDIFQTRHNYLPGDYPFATDVWGTLHATPSTCQSTPSTDKRTCNGNGNGQIQSDTYEMFRAWQHLANEGLIDGDYTGVRSGTSLISHDEDNTLNGEISKTLWSIRHFPNFTNTNWYNLGEEYGHIMQLGRKQSNFLAEGDFISPRELQAIDEKIDDGKPARGWVVLFDWTNCSTATLANQLNSDYDLRNKERDCSIILRLDED